MPTHTRALRWAISALLGATAFTTGAAAPASAMHAPRDGDSTQAHLGAFCQAQRIDLEDGEPSDIADLPGLHCGHLLYPVTRQHTGR